MKIKIGNIEGATSKSGSKQNKIYTVVSNCSTVGFYNAIDEKGREYLIWDCNGDWSKIGIRKRGVSRTSYTTDFEILN